MSSILVDNPYRVAVFGLIFIMLVIGIIDCIIYPILWTTIFFYALTQVLMIFRLFGRNFVTIAIHAAATSTILIILYLHYFNDFGEQDYEYYKEKTISSYQLLMNPKPQTKQLPHRADYISFWLTYPLAILVFASFSGICCILGLSLNLRKMFAAVHSVFGLSIAMIYFLICVFYSHYFENYDATVVIKMIYYLLFLFVMLSPNLLNDSQILSKQFREEDEDEEE